MRCRAGTCTPWNLQDTCGGFADTSIALGVCNLFNTDPSFSNSTGVGFLPGFADTRGRTCDVRLS